MIRSTTPIIGCLAILVWVLVGQDDPLSIEPSPDDEFNWLFFYSAELSEAQKEEWLKISSESGGAFRGLENCDILFTSTVLDFSDPPLPADFIARIEKSVTTTCNEFGWIHLHEWMKTTKSSERPTAQFSVRCEITTISDDHGQVFYYVDFTVNDLSATAIRFHSGSGKRLTDSARGQCFSRTSPGVTSQQNFTAYLIGVIEYVLGEFKTAYASDRGRPCASEVKAAFIARHKARLADTPNK